MKLANSLFWGSIILSASLSFASPGLARARHQAPGADAYNAMAPISPAGSLVRSANDCAPDSPEPVWGGRQALLGYVCARVNN